MRSAPRVRNTRPRPIVDRLADGLEFDTFGGCWLWSGSAIKAGFGRIDGSRPDTRPHLVHRVAFEHWVRPLEPLELVEQICGVRVCCNPDHLVAVRGAGGWKGPRLGRPRAGESVADRLFSRLEVQPGGCWEWDGPTNVAGYASIGRDGEHLLAHRVMFELANGRELQDGELVLHRCDNPRCCNPLHLFAGSHRDNSQDMLAKGRQGWRAK